MSLIDDYRNGKRYGTDWKAPTVQHMNDLVGTVSDDDLLVNNLSQEVDNTDANKVGTASITIIGGGTNKKFKASYLKGEKGDTGNGIEAVAIAQNNGLDFTMTDGSHLYTDSVKGEKGDTGNTGPQGEQGNQGIQGKSYNPRGVWASGTAYVNNATIIDTIFYNGSSYYCKVSHTASNSILPTNTDYWGMLAEQGQAPDIIDNVTTADSTKALSANQGKLLNDEITKIENGTTEVGNAKKIRGVDFIDNETAVIGNYIVPKVRILNDTTINIPGTSTITLNEAVATGDVLRFRIKFTQSFKDLYVILPVVPSSSNEIEISDCTSATNKLRVDTLIITVTTSTQITFSSISYYQAQDGSFSGGEGSARIMQIAKMLY